MPWGRYVRAMLRYWWLIAGITVFGGSVGLLAARQVAPQYDVYATIWLNAESPQSRAAGPIRAERLLNTTSWPELLGSFAILDSVARKMRLYVKVPKDIPSSLFAQFDVRDRFSPGTYEIRVRPEDKHYELLNAQSEIVERGVLGDSIGRAQGFRWAPQPSLFADHRAVRFTVNTPREAAVDLRNHMNPSVSRESSLLRITLTGYDPILAAATLEAVVSEFEATAARLKTRNLAEFATTLDQQLAYAAEQLREAEIALEGFRVRTITLPSENGTVAAGLEVTRDPVLRHFFDQKLLLDSVRNDRESLQQALQAVADRHLAAPALLAVPAAQSAPELVAAIGELSAKEIALRNLRELYTEQHPKVVELRATVERLERETIPRLVASVLDRLQRRETNLAERVAGSSRELRQIPTRTIEEMRLRRNVDTRLGLYSMLKSRYEEARLAEASALPDMSVLDHPVVPQYPSRSHKTKLVAAALLASLAGAVVLALLLDVTDRRFRHPEQATNQLGLAIVGVVPRIRSASSDKTNYDQAWQLTEAFRTLRMGVNHASRDRPIMLTVTSPGSGEGKSFVAANLALSFVSTGSRTLLIDGDVRRGSLHTVFDLPSQPGLTEFLEGRAPLASVLRTTEGGLTVLTSGVRGRHSPELLASKLMLDTFGVLRDSFDVIIVDAAPLSAGIDAFVLATQTTNMLMVLRAGKTDCKLADAKLRMVDRLPVRVIGAVLNAVKASGPFRYYAYDYAADEDRGARTEAFRIAGVPEALTRS